MQQPQPDTHALPERPLVSDMVPVYNVLPHLGQALDSVLAQTCRDLEVIVVDDGSTVGTCELCDEHARRDGRLTVIHQENRGLSAARNVGIDRATGDWILFLNSDDWMEPNTVEALLREADATGADIFCCQHLTEREGVSTTSQAAQHTLNERDVTFFSHACTEKIGLSLGSNTIAQSSLATFSIPRRGYSRA